MATVLIVDDDAAVVHMLELTFSLEGFDTEAVLDGRDAVERLDGPAAEVVILDIMLPGMDGYGVLEELRQRPEWAGTKVVVASALKSDEEVWRGWSSGADYYLVKPFDLDHLRDVVNRFIAGAPVT